MADRFVIASQINVGGFADIDLSEAIQFFLDNWIASSPASLEGERLGFSQ